MIEFIPFRREHLYELTPVTGVQSWYLDTLERETCISVLSNGELIASGGVLTTAIRTGVLWSALSQTSGPHMIAITRAARRLMEAAALRRIEATVEKGFIPGCRWLVMLGFRLETPDGMRAFGPDGKDHLLYGWTP